MAAGERVVRIILTGESGGLVKSFEVAGVAAETARGKFETMQKVGKGMSSVGSTMTRMAVPLVAFGAYAVKASMNYQQAMTRISTQTSMSTKNAAGVASHFNKLSGQVGFSSSQLAEGLYPIASEGLKGAKALDALTAAAKGAQIGGDSLTSTASALSSVLGAGAKDIHSASEAMVVMERSAGLGKMKLSDLTDAMSTGVVSEATGMGLGFRDLGAALGAMTKQGVPAEQEASRLKLSLTKMAAPTGVALKQVRALGLGQFQLASDLRKPNGMITALRDLRSHLQGLSPNEQNQALANMFGQSRGLSNIRGLLRALPVMTNIRGQLSQATGSQFAGRWKEQLQTPAQKFANVMAEVKTSVTNFGTAIMPIVTAILPRLTKDITGLVGWMSHLPKPVREGVVGFTAFLAIGGPTLIFIGKLVTAVGTVGKAMEAMKIVTIATSTVMKASLIGLVVFALVEMLTHLQTTKRIALEVFDGIKTAVVLFGRALGKIFTGIYHVITWPFIKAFALIKNGLRDIMKVPGSILHGAGSVLHTLSFGALSTGGPVKPRYLAMGGPSGTDTVPGWLTPGEFVLNRAATSRIGMPALEAMNRGGSLESEVRIAPAPVTINLDSRTIWRGLMQFAASRQARGTGLVGGGMMTGATG